jgi:hypothetical protein
MKLRLVDPSRIDLYASQIIEIGDSVSDPNLFDRVKEACLNQQAFLFCSIECFVVLKPLHDSVLAWVAGARCKVNHDDFIVDLDQLCADVSAKKVFFYSNRRGFEKLAKKFGFISSLSMWMGKPILMWERHYVQ